MYLNSVKYKYVRKRFLLFKWRHNTTLVNKAVLATLLACITGLMAQARIYLPWTPVPITGQTFAVLLSAVVLGKWWGGISQSIYVTLGLIGIPWFAGWKGGTAVLLGPTGGYIVGFILAAFFLGHFTDKYLGHRKFLPILALMIVANFVLIYVPGLLHLGFWFYFTTGSFLDIRSLLMAGLIPFVAGDFIKLFAAALGGKFITPKVRFDIPGEPSSRV